MSRSPRTSSGRKAILRYLLFTECLQNDFVAPMNAGAPLPNELHIGRAESRRLLGDPEGAWTEEGPLARFLSAFLTGAGRDHVSVHIRDWHDPEDPATRTHLEHFGSHCVRGTRGAEFVVPLAPVLNAGGLVVDSEVLSDFVGTTLEQTLRPLLSGPVRAGIIGVWTDFKVQYLAYELQTRLGLRDVAVCSALTASRSRLAHRQALEHMAANLGVTVIDSIPEFLAWLGIEAQAAAPLAAKGTPRPTSSYRMASRSTTRSAGSSSTCIAGAARCSSARSEAATRARASSGRCRSIGWDGGRYRS